MPAALAATSLVPGRTFRVRLEGKPIGRRLIDNPKTPGVHLHTDSRSYQVP